MALLDLFTNLINIILQIVNTTGYFGIFLGMTIENTFFPLPSELILIPAGVLIAHGEMTFTPVLLASIAGSLVGSTINYVLALYLGRKFVLFLVGKYGHFLFLNKKTINTADVYFKKHGEITTFVGKLIPVVRQLISLPAGFAKMNYTRFLLFTALGAAVWTVFLVSLGFFFGGNSEPIVKIVTAILLIILFVIAFIYYIIKNKREKKDSDAL